ncbi:hypothetical protein G9401_09140 [Weissella paramesenteroides]|uniref:hypothetical protein n=1 Tax=Weissella paramesenteroides TaxID=1249 RepID=UPI0023F82EBF|nr:hypothetical protein [Weissella paramesenteroides]MDF8367861.1 hypothetical protein [Weissella paramesenteroides]MDF8375719.1 hypothetical protein [Weissella paramesenteroides]
MTKTSNELQQLLTQVEQLNTQELWEQALHNPDPDKRQVFEALFTYVLDKQQAELIKQNEFVV